MGGGGERERNILLNLEYFYKLGMYIMWRYCLLVGKEGWKRGYRCKCCVFVCLWLLRLYNIGLIVYFVWLILCVDLEILILECVCFLMIGNGLVCYRGVIWRKRYGVVFFVCFSGLLDIVD